MKVVAFIGNLSKGGAQGVFVNTINYLYEEGLDISVVVQNLHDAVYMDMLNPKISIASLNSKSAKEMLPALKKYVSSHKFTHAFVFGPEITVNLYIIRKLLHKDFKILSRCLNTLTQEYTYANSIFRKYITANLVRCVYPKVDGIIAQSDGMKIDLITNWNIDTSKVMIINNALQPAYELEAQTKITTKKEAFFLYAGRLEHQKGIEMLLEAFAELGSDAVRLKIVGNGSLREKLKEKAFELGIADRVDFIEYTKNIMQYYKSAIAVVMTSYYEGFPNVLVEAIACGTPVVAYDLPSGPKEIIVEGVNGHLVPYLDVNAFSKSLGLTLMEKWDENEVKKTSFRYMRKEIMPKYIYALTAL